MHRALLPLIALLAAWPATAAPRPSTGGATRPKVEVAFVLDATGSMGPWIKEAREKIKGIAADLAAGDPSPDVRFALVRYRDTSDAFTTQVVPFTRHLDVMRLALDGTEPKGGGDTPEAVIEGLRDGVRALDWREGDDVLRLLYLVGDAPPQTGAGRPHEADVLAEALQRGIVIHTIACGRMDSRGQTFFERVARHSEGRAFRLAQLGNGARGADDAKAAGTRATGSLSAAVSGTARAYADSVGVRFDPAARRVAINTEPLALDGVDGAVAESGLLGAQVREITDLATWADLWRAHQSVSAAATPPPAVDFTRHHVLVLGGADAGLALAELRGDLEARVARVAPASPGVRFVRVPAVDLPLITLNAEGGAR